MALTGRDAERAELERLYGSGKAELVAIYGRRRVGKTYLVDETFRECITFRHAGLSPVDKGQSHLLRAQLNHFYLSLQYQGLGRSRKPTSWMEALFLLQQFLDERDDGNRQLVFLDELPWMDTPKSGFMTAFEGFWNNWGCHRNNLMVVVCGSANSWILDKLINNHGDLYNRVTYQMRLSPFTLCECEEFLAAQHISLSRYDIAQSWMIFGGIPFYLDYFRTGMSLPQIVDETVFSENAPLKEEYDRLFATIFNEPEAIKRIVGLLYGKNAGMQRKEIVDKLGMTDGSSIGDRLNALVSSGIVWKYIPFGMGKRQTHYKLVDPFCLFYLRFVANRDGLSPSYWQEIASSQSAAVWRGLAFENLCFQHIRQIKRALGVEGVSSTQSAWSKKDGDEDGTQIDLLIQRRDGIVNMCELKFYREEFEVDKAYEKVIRHREGLLAGEIAPSMAIHSTLITTFGLKYNTYSGAFAKVVTLDDLFAF